MDKSRICVQKGLEAAKKSCQKKTNLLVYEGPGPRTEPPMRKVYVPHINSNAAKQIRICSAKELKKMCPPPKCSCPAEPKKGNSSLLSLIKTGTKCALAFGLLYGTVNLGTWGDSCDTYELFKAVCVMCSSNETPKRKYGSQKCKEEADLQQNSAPGACDVPFPDHDKGLHWLKDSYNNIVYFLFSSIAGFPYNIINWFNCCLKNIEEVEKIEDDDYENCDETYIG